jgi:xylulokinase
VNSSARARLVVGVDSSTQSCKVVIADIATGEVIRSASRPHPEGTEVAPAAWLEALKAALAEAGGTDDVAAIGVGGQQHGMVCLDEAREVLRHALLWNDTRSADAARDLVEELGGGETGRQAWADAVGVVPVASFTVTKLRWLAEHEPDVAKRTEAVCLPHDWLTAALIGDKETLVTDRSDASGTGYWSPSSGSYRRDMLTRALGHDAELPVVLGPSDTAGSTPSGVLVSAGCGDNAGAALGLGLRSGDVLVSVGTSGVACAISGHPTSDGSGTVAGFADATGQFLPLVATLNAARTLDAVAGLLGVNLEEFSRLALSAPAGAEGLVLTPYLEGERTPNLPEAAGAVHGVRLANATAANLARAAVEGMLCGLADAIDALADNGVVAERIVLIGGGARSEAVREVAPTVFGREVHVPSTAEYVALGAARQAAWALEGTPAPPSWQVPVDSVYTAAPAPAVRERYAHFRDLRLAEAAGNGDEKKN